MKGDISKQQQNNLHQTNILYGTLWGYETFLSFNTFQLYVYDITLMILDFKRSNILFNLFRFVFRVIMDLWARENLNKTYIRAKNRG